MLEVIAGVLVIGLAILLPIAILVAGRATPAAASPAAAASGRSKWHNAGERVLAAPEW